MPGFTERGGWWVVAQAMMLAAVAAALIACGADWWAWSGVIGWALAGAAATMAVWGLLSLGSNLTPYPHPLPQSETVAHGPYRLVRHPIYGGIVLGSLGLGVADGNLPVIGLAIGLVVLFTGKTGFEERHLVAQDPAYEDYRARVRKRMIPWLW